MFQTVTVVDDHDKQMKRTRVALFIQGLQVEVVGIGAPEYSGSISLNPLVERDGQTHWSIRSVGSLMASQHQELVKNGRVVLSQERGWRLVALPE